MKIKTAGLRTERNNILDFWPEPTSCGVIEDGVSLDFGYGAFVIDFKDFKLMYEAAVEARSAQKKVG